MSDIDENNRKSRNHQPTTSKGNANPHSSMSLTPVFMLHLLEHSTNATSSVSSRTFLDNWYTHRIDVATFWTLAKVHPKIDPFQSVLAHSSGKFHWTAFHNCRRSTQCHVRDGDLHLEFDFALLRSRCRSPIKKHVGDMMIGLSRHSLQNETLHFSSSLRASHRVTRCENSNGGSLHVDVVSSSRNLSPKFQISAFQGSRIQTKCRHLTRSAS